MHMNLLRIGFISVLCCALGRPVAAQTTRTPRPIRSTTGTANQFTTVPRTMTPHPTPVRTPVTTMTEEQVAAHFHPKSLPAATTNVVSLVYNAARRSQLDPCGCVSKQLGGVDKEGRLYVWLDEQGIPSVRVDAGGFLKIGTNPYFPVQAKHLLHAMTKMGMDAINVGVDDLGQGLELLREAETSGPIPFVSANIIGPDDKPIFEPFRIKTVKTQEGQEVKFGIIGVTRPPVQSALARQAKLTSPGATVTTNPLEQTAIDQNTTTAWHVMPPPDAIAKYLPDLRKKVDVVVLLDYESRDFTIGSLKNRLGENASMIDVAIAGEYLSPNAMITMQGPTRVVSTGFEGRYVSQMMLEMRDGKIADAKNALIEVVQNIPSVPEITNLMEESREAVKKIQMQLRSTGGTRATGGTTTRSRATISYAGHNACASCHSKEYAQWRTTKHSKAMASLLRMDKDKQNDPDMVRRHVTGYRVDNGFVDIATTPKMADVQCEECHGPGFQHVVDKRRAQILKQSQESGTGAPTPAAAPSAKLRTKFDLQFCMRCHDTKFDQDFDFERDIKLVDHSRPEQKASGAAGTRSSSNETTETSSGIRIEG